MTVEIRALRPEDDRSSFRSGDEALDLYFHRYAGQNQFRHHIGVTYVAFDELRLLGFLTVSPASLDAAEATSRRRMPPYPVPVLRIARLAVDQRARGLGIGQALLRFGVELAETMRDEIGCVGVLVDAKDGAVEFYRRLGFEAVAVVDGAARIVPRTTPMFLSLGSVPRRIRK
jgi:GNAT superfamily N-acetyltransferase